MPGHAKYQRAWRARTRSETTPETLHAHIYDLYGKNNRNCYIDKSLYFQRWDEHVQKHGYKCSVTGHPFDMTVPHLRPSVDQISPGSGYWAWNIRFTTWAYNRARGNLSDKEFSVLCATSSS